MLPSERTKDIRDMTTIESKQVVLNTSAQEVYGFVSDLNNFEKLLPEGRISDFSSDGTSCKFKVNGMATIGLKIKEEHPPSRLLLESYEGPFPFTLDVHILDEDGSSRAHQVAQVDVNPMMKMMVEKPLRNLFDHIADQLKRELDS